MGLLRVKEIDGLVAIAQETAEGLVVIRITKEQAEILITRIGAMVEKPKKQKDDRFEAFWSAYPKRVGRGAAEKSFKKVKVGDFEALMASLASHKRSPEWLKEDGQFIPHPATWLNQKRWLDDVSGPHLSLVTNSPTCCICGGAASRKEMNSWYCSKHDRYSTAVAA